MSILPWEPRTCDRCGGTFEALPTSTRTTCYECKPPAWRRRRTGKRAGRPDTRQ